MTEDSCSHFVAATRDCDRASIATINPPLLLDLLPRDLLCQSILVNFLDAKSLLGFWHAICGCNSGNNDDGSPCGSMESLMLQVLQHKTSALLGKDDKDESSESSTVFHGDDLVKRQHRVMCQQVFKIFREATVLQKCRVVDWQTIYTRLAILDYCETVPHNVIWCGTIRIKFDRVQYSNSDGSENEPPIRVALVVHPKRWCRKEIRLWRNATFQGNHYFESNNTQHTHNTSVVIAKAVHHNFLPVGPNRGRLVGLTPEDRNSLARVAMRLDRGGLVGRFSCQTKSILGSSSKASSDDTVRVGQFTIKLTHFQQAQQRLDAVFRRGEPGGMPLNQEKEGMVLPDSNTYNQVDYDCDSLLGMVLPDRTCNQLYHDRNSLLCCWSHEFLWEDNKAFPVETAEALVDLAADCRALGVPPPADPYCHRGASSSIVSPSSPPLLQASSTATGSSTCQIAIT